MKTIEKNIFYNQDGIIVRHATLKDAKELSIKLRENDIDEIWASHNHTPQVALELSLKNSNIALAIENNGSVVGMFGICPDGILSEKASIWFLASDEIETIQRRFLRHSKEFVNMFLEYYSYLYNYVDRRNSKSILWLSFLGANIRDAVEYGVEKKLFHYFSFER